MSGLDDIRAFYQIARTALNANTLVGHDADWCRNCQEGCGEVYGGCCDCCNVDRGEATVPTEGAQP